MFFLKSDELRNHIDAIVHQDTQQHATHFDLTVDKIYTFEKAGALDFGGSEYKKAEKSIVEPKKEQGDDYGWWNLPAGHYQATMNEQIKEVEDTVALLGLHEHAQSAGIIGNATYVSLDEAANEITFNFTTPEPGCNIKENARFAVLYLLAS